MASDLGGNDAWDNTAVIQRILELRREEAVLLGYRNFAEVSLVAEDGADRPTRCCASCATSRTARDPSRSATTPRSRSSRATSSASPTSHPWDIAYASEKLKAARYAFSEQDVKQYFPEDRVLAGLFRVVETIYGVAIEAAQAPTWHPSVRFFRIRDRRGELVGEFYLDLYAREGKQSGAWMDDAINRRRLDGRVQHPVAYLTCNFAGPVDGKARAVHAPAKSSPFSTSSGTACTSSSRESTSSACPGCRASSGMPSSCRASSWRTSPGSGTCFRT